MAFLDRSALVLLWNKIVDAINTATSNKVDKVSGKGLSTNDYTTTEKNKLAGIAEGANKTIVDAAFSSTSTNPVQSNVVYAAIEEVRERIPATDVANQQLTTDRDGNVVWEDKLAYDIPDFTFFYPGNYNGLPYFEVQGEETGGLRLKRFFQIAAGNFPLIAFQNMKAFEPSANLPEAETHFSNEGNGYVSVSFNVYNQEVKLYWFDGNTAIALDYINPEAGTITPEAGIYVLGAAPAFVCGYEGLTQTIDPKYLPEEIARVADIPTYGEITVDQIDAICGANIVSASEVTL